LTTLVSNIEPLISVIIPCYNHARYLPVAIASVYAQEGYSNFEIVVVDDGSVDDTKNICSAYSGVRYVYQDNAGLSAARNTGIENSSGKYLIFLDADDWLLPNAMATNASKLIGHDEVAFVSGAYSHFYEGENRYHEIRREVNVHHYCAFLEGNYIGMHATVLFNRWAFQQFRYDVALRACEDYDIYLKIAREFKVLHHTSLIAVYRLHQTNMSGNTVLMVQSALQVLKEQKKQLRNDLEKASYEKGILNWKIYYSDELYEKLLSQLQVNKVNKTDLKTLREYNRNLYDVIRKKQHEKKVAAYKKKVPSFLKRVYFYVRKLQD
jgi:glycosyltransferase involved in cell wall biosynthesis